MSKHMLTISTEYVPDWTFVEAIRELFQNALDNEISNPSNKMSWNYDGVSKLTIGNKSSVLSKKSLLLGSTTKRDDSSTIGQHGEGYKIALMVLLREGKGITFYNYGSRELWTTRLVKSRNYDNQIVPEINVDKKFMFTKVPDDNLTIVVDGVSPTDYELIQKSNLRLREQLDKIDTPEGTLLISDEEKGNFYVGGLFIGRESEYLYGYDLKVGSVNLDRDRRMLRGWELDRVTNDILYALPKEESNYVLRAIKEKSKDVAMSRNYAQHGIYSNRSDIKDEIAKGVQEEALGGRNRAEVVFVHNNDTLNLAKKQQPEKEPVLVEKLEYEILKDASTLAEMDSFTEEVSPLDDLKIWFDKVKSKLSEDEVEEFNFIVKQL